MKLFRAPQVPIYGSDSRSRSCESFYRSPACRIFVHCEPLAQGLFQSSRSLRFHIRDISLPQLGRGSRGEDSDCELLFRALLGPTCRLIPYPFFRLPNFMVIGSLPQNRVTNKRVWYQPTGRSAVCLGLRF